MTLDVELGRLEGQVRVLEERLAAADAAEEHHRAEMEVARSEAADAQVALKDAQVRMEEWRRRVDEMQRRLEDAEKARRQAEEERSAVIAVLGRKARKQLSLTE